MRIKDAPSACRHNNKKIEQLNKVRLEKEEIAKQLSIDKQKEEFIDARCMALLLAGRGIRKLSLRSSVNFRPKQQSIVR